MFLSPECGGVLNRLAGGGFTSPGYLVSNYSSNLNCEWLVENSQHVNSSIVVLLEDLHVQDDQTCGKDYLQFRLGGCFMKALRLLLERQQQLHTF